MYSEILTVLAMASGFGIGWFLKGRSSSNKDGIKTMEAQLATASQNLDKVQEAYNTLKVDTARDIARLQTNLEAQRASSQDKESLFEESKKELSLQVQHIVSEVFENKTKKFADQNEERLDTILKPLQTKIGEFQSEIKESAKQTIEERTLLKKQIADLANMNEKLSTDAKNLVIALKGENKTQGNWGELILEKLLDMSGLEKGVDYTAQEGFKSEDGTRFIPDVVVKLPEQKCLIVDSKVSLTAYERLSNAEDTAQRQQAQKDHITSIKGHIKELSAKNYENLTGVNTVDFILLFIPIEAAYSTALQIEHGIMGEAFAKNIVIVTPSSLFATLRTVAYLWRQEKQTKNAKDIAKRAGALYDKFHGFYENMQSIGNQIDKTRGTYDEAMRKLKDGQGSLIRQTEMLKKLGAQTNKKLPDVSDNS